MTLKTTLPSSTTAPDTSNASAVHNDSSSPVVQWAEARRAYPIYAALAKQFDIVSAPYPDGELPPDRPTREILERDFQWLDNMDAQVKAFQIRQLPPATLNAKEENLRAFIQRHLQKADKSDADRDKIDFLLVQYFALCAPESKYHEEISLEDVATVVKPVLVEADATPLEWCAPLETILDSVRECRSLRDLLESGLLEQGRLLKETSGSMFYDPAALVTFARFNFLMRRAFIQLLHVDQVAVIKAIEELDRAGVRTVDCRRVGFSAAEPTSQLRLFAENWRPLYHKDYSENAVSRSFEQLLALRADLEEAVANLYPRPVSDPAPSAQAVATSLDQHVRTAPHLRPSPPEQAPVSGMQANPLSANIAAVGAHPEESQPAAPESSGLEIPLSVVPNTPATKSKVPEAPSTPVTAPPRASEAPPKSLPTSAAEAPASTTADMESCLEAIWEQLIAAPPSRGRSMSTVVLKNTKILLSSWEVAAFVSEGGQDSEDLRRAVVARAMISVAMDSRKQSGETASLTAALEIARAEVSYFQGRVEQAKRAKNTEAAVNLGISTKRLLSVIEEAEKLQP
ncbi:MAG: hypothetical protein WCA98_09080 [Candidatus Acidiferrales bacterium]